MLAAPCGAVRRHVVPYARRVRCRVRAVCAAVCAVLRRVRRVGAVCAAVCAPCAKVRRVRCRVRRRVNYSFPREHFGAKSALFAFWSGNVHFLRKFINCS